MTRERRLCDQIVVAHHSAGFAGTHRRRGDAGRRVTLLVHAEDMTGQWTDRPRERWVDDELDRVAFGKRIATRMREVHDPTQSVVFGLVGPWGSGKTSLINFATEALTKAEQDCSTWEVANFSPWAANDVESLFQEFYAALASALPPNKPGTARAKKALANLIQIAAPLASALPYGGHAVTLSANKFAKYLNSRPSWTEAFNAASLQLQGLETPVLLVVDDVDRLQPDELLVLLKVVRLLGRFPGVDYLLAYDHESVVRVLSKALANPHMGDADFAGRFIEKIVQYPFEVPPLRRDQIIGRLSAGLDGEASLEESATRGWTQFDRLFTTVLTTPRAIDRYIEQHLITRLALPDGEFDQVDLDLAVLLRTRFPTVFSRLTSVREELISGRLDAIRVGKNGEFERRPFDVTELLDGLGERHSEQARKVITLLFPKTCPDTEVAARGGKVAMRMAHPDYFERYVSSELSPTDVSDAEVLSAADEAASGAPDSLVRALTQLPRNRGELAFNKAKQFFDDRESDPSELLPVFRAVASALAAIEPVEDPRRRLVKDLRAWASQLLAGIPIDEPADSVLAALELLTPSGIVYSVVDNGLRQRYESNAEDELGWIPGVTLRLAESAKVHVVSHLTQRDDAPYIAYFRSALNFAIEHGPEESTRQAINSLLANGKASIEDLAARFVSVHSGTEPSAPSWIALERPLLEESDQEIFWGLVSNRSDPWFNLPAEPHTDTSDTSWENRRKSARGRFRQR